MINEREETYEPNGNALDYYLRDLAASHPISSAEEIALATRMKQGDLSARDKLVEANLRFVVTVALKYKNRGVPLSDLISAGNLGLITATERFDETRGFKFISYAVWWIRQAILQTLAEHGRLVRLPVNRLELIRRITHYISDCRRNEGLTPTEAEIAQAFDITEEQVIDTLSTSPIIFSLDTPLHDEHTSLLDVMADKNQASPDEEMLLNALKEDIREMLDTLDDREEEIIRLYFGLDSQEWTLEAIARKFNLTRERVRQIKEKALRKLRHPTRGRKLVPYAEAV